MTSTDTQMAMSWLYKRLRDSI